MKKIYSAALAACIQLSAVSTHAQEYNLDDDVVIVVTKRAKLASMVGSAFSRIDSEEIQCSQSVSLTQALSTIPGLMAQEYGGRGSYSQFSLRGNTAGHTLYLLDGIRINTDSSADAKTFLSYAGASGLGTIEVARGPQSSLYGADGIGGVISMESERGKGKPSLVLSSEFGSFSTFRERMGSQGEIDKLAYSLSYEREDTANNRPHNDFGSNRYALRLDTDLSQDLSLRLNFRGHTSDYEDPTYLGLEKVESNLVSLITNWKVSDIWTQKLTLGSYFDRYDYQSPTWKSLEESANYSADWMHSIQLSETNIGTAGVEFNYQTTQTSLPLYKESSNWAAYIQDEWEVIENFNITSGARYDSYSHAGGAWTYRFTGAYLFTKTDTKIRSSYGTAFKAPSLQRLYSPDPYSLGNSDLKPETSQGWDVGFDQYLLSRKMVFSGTYFQNDITNLIDFKSTDPINGYGTFVNRQKAKNNGVELELKATLMEDWITRLAYTYTESTSTTESGSQRRGLVPRQQFGLDTNYCLFDKWTIGCGVTIVADREDQFTSGLDIEDFFTARVYSRYEHNDHFAIFGRVENVTNTDYEYSTKVPALPIGFYGGVELKF